MTDMTPTRFLAATPWADWQMQEMAGDASGRRFARLTGPDGQSAILMQADPAVAGGHAAFLTCARHLTAHGLAAPEILKAEGPFALVGDLGPDTFAQWIARHPEDETVLYSAAVDLLVALQDIPPPAGLMAIDPATGAQMLDPFFDFHAPELGTEEKDTLRRALEAALSAHAPVAQTFALRDFHAENLMWRPDRQGLDRVGLIDFQDAVMAPAVYDLVSLLRDARRDVSEALYTAMRDRFAAATGADPAATAAACAVVAVQRNLRILGIFARLAQRDGKQRYLAFIPRVERMLRADLAHPALADLARITLPLLQKAQA